MTQPKGISRDVAPVSRVSITMNDTRDNVDGENAPTMDRNTVQIFDTTLRDGEQSPGATLNLAEKLEIGRQLARLGVDIIEAGFPIASPGDFEAVTRLAQDV